MLGQKSIFNRVPTSTAAFLGVTERGPLRPILVTGFNEYARRFGTAEAVCAFMPEAVRGFFANGGAQFTDARSVSPARPRAFYAGLKATF